MGNGESLLLGAGPPIVWRSRLALRISPNNKYQVTSMFLGSKRAEESALFAGWQASSASLEGLLCASGLHVTNCCNAKGFSGGIVQPYS